MLDSTNRPKGTQRRLARKRSNAQAQNQMQGQGQGQVQPDAARMRRGNRPNPGLSGQKPRPKRPLGVGANPQIASSSPQARPEPRGAAPRSLAGAAQSDRMRRPPARSQPVRSQSAEGAGSRLQGSELQQDLRPVAPGKRRPEPSRSRLNVPFRAGRSDAQSVSAGRRRTSLLVHLCRLLILGVGVGAIVGTIFSVANPSMRQPPTTSQTADPVGQPNNAINRAAVPGTLATISSVRIGREMTDLVAKVTPLTRDLTDLVPGVFLMDFDNGNYLSFNGSTAFSSASMIKLPILIAFFQDVDAGKIKLDEMLSLQQADVAEGSGDMQDAEAGTQFTALDTATNMIITSDNTATNMIIRRLGGSEVLNQRFRQWGLQQTLLRKPLPDLEGLNTTSPKELVSLLALLNDGKLLSMKSRDRTFDIMRRTVTDTLLPSVISPGSTVAHKTGDIGSLVGDVGVVDLPSGRRYGIAVVVKRPHNDGRAQDLIRQIAAVVYEHFGGQPMMAPSPVASPPAQVAPQTVTPGMPGMPPSANPAGNVAPMAPAGAAAPLTAPLAPAAPIAPTAPIAPVAPAPVAPIPEAVAPEPEPYVPESVDQADQGEQPQDPASEQEPPL